MNKNINPNLRKLAELTHNPKLKTDKTIFEKPVQQIQTPTHSIESYSFLEGDFGREIYAEYQERAKSVYNNASALNNLSFSDNVVKGSNPFAFVLLDEILRKQGVRIASPADLERCLEKGELDLRGTYGDSGLVLRNDENPNEYLARNLSSQVKEKGYKVGRSSKIILLTGLDLKYDTNSPQDLVFQLIDSSKIIQAPQFEHKNNQKKFNKADENGLPIFDSNGSRTLYTGKGGLRRLYRYWSLDLCARYDDLAYSNSDGRVVVCAEGTRARGK